MKHRTALVTALSIVGVVVAGVLAIGANVGILASAGPADIGTATPTTSPVTASVAAGTQEVSATVGDQGELLAYEVPNVGVVTVRRNGDALDLVEVDAPDWDWSIATRPDAVGVAFVSGQRQYVFVARIIGDQVEVSVEDRSASTVDGDDDHDGPEARERERDDD